MRLRWLRSRQSSSSRTPRSSPRSAFPLPPLPLSLLLPSSLSSPNPFLPSSFPSFLPSSIPPFLHSSLSVSAPHPPLPLAAHTPQSCPGALLSAPARPALTWHVEFPDSD
eukprot:1603753-Rhodomonas_salina.2